MKRNVVDQWLKDPDNKARLFVWITKAMVITTFMITIGLILYIVHLVGFF